MAIKDREQRLAYDRARGLANRDKRNAISRAWRLANPEKMKAARSAWRLANPEKMAAISARWHRTAGATRSAARWRAANPDKEAARSARRYAAKLQATPAWANHDLINTFYRMAEIFGLHVDHIVPLQSRKVCGLHVEHNLQLLTSAENLRKGNRFEQ